MHPVLYSFRRCPYAMRARLAMAASGQVCELREVVLANKPDALRQASAKATVPVLVLPDGQVIDESLDIMLWARSHNTTPNWLSRYPTELSAMLALIADCDGPFKQQLDRYKYPQRFALADGCAQRQQGALFLAELERRLQEHGMLMEQETSLADMAIAPFVRQFAHTDKAWFAAQAWPALQHWLAAFEDSAAFAQVMCKLPPWAPRQETVFFPPQA